MWWVFKVLAAVLLALGGAPVPVGWQQAMPGGPGIDGKAAFAQLKRLEGTWTGTGVGTGASRTVFELTANGSVLMERYSNGSLPGGGHMVTAYHLDGRDLILTHYCIAANQPVLRAERHDTDAGEIQFEFLRASNLSGAGAGHMRRARFRIPDADHFTAEWEFFESGALKSTEIETFTRVRPQSQPGNSEALMAKYMLLLHDDPSTWATVSPEQIQQAIEKYVAWGTRLRNAGVLLGSDKLTDDPGRVVRGRDGQLRVTDGPFSEAKEVLGGYYTISATSYEEAVQQLRDCPHLEYGGTVEIRQVDEMLPG